MKVEIVRGGKKILFKLLEPVTVHGYEVPEGFITDFASVPRSLWNVLPPLGRHNEAALLHDWLYDNRIGTRAEADKIFLNVMLQCNVKYHTALIMWLGVRLGGGKWWRD